MRVTASAFIFKGPGLSPATHRADFHSASFTQWVVGVSSVDEAHAVAADLLGEGAQVIELCGGFNDTDAAAIAASIGHAVPVGAVSFAGRSLERLNELLGRTQSPHAPVVSDADSA
jgi:hypothetical protein